MMWIEVHQPDVAPEVAEHEDDLIGRGDWRRAWKVRGHHHFGRRVHRDRFAFRRVPIRRRNAAHERRCEPAGSCPWACNTATARPQTRRDGSPSDPQPPTSDSGIGRARNGATNTLGRFARTRRIEGDPSSIRRQPRIPDRPFGALQQLTLVAGFRVDERNRVQARKPFDDEPAFIHPLARPAAAIVTQRSPGPVGQADDEDGP